MPGPPALGGFLDPKGRDDMSELKCRHGISQQQTCRRCGRIKKVRAPAWEAREQTFNESIRKLEAAVKPLLEEVERARAASNVTGGGLISEDNSEDPQPEAGPDAARRSEGPPVRSYPARPGWTL